MEEPAEGRIGSLLVDRAAVDRVLTARGDVAIYAQATFFFGGGAASALIAWATVPDSAPLPIVFVSSLALTVVAALLWRHYHGRVREAETALTSSNYLAYQREVTAIVWKSPSSGEPTAPLPEPPGD